MREEPDTVRRRQELDAFRQEFQTCYQVITTNNSLSIDEKEKQIWQKISTRPAHLSMGLEVVLGNLSQKTSPEQKDTATAIVGKLVKTRIPNLLAPLNGEKRFSYCMGIVPPLASCLASSENFDLPKETTPLLKGLTFNWNREKQLLIMLETAAESRREIILDSENDYWTQFHKRFFEVTAWLDKRVQTNNFDEEALRVAVAAQAAGLLVRNGVGMPVSIFDTSSAEAKVPWVSAISYLDNFRRHFSGTPNGYLDALKIIAQAIGKSSEVTKSWLLHFLTNRDAVWPSMGMDGLVFTSKDANFVSFLHQLLTTLTDEGKDDQRSRETMKQLLDTTTVQERSGEINNLLAAGVKRFPGFTREEILALAKNYLKFIGTIFSIDFDTELPEEDLRQLTLGDYHIVCEGIKPESVVTIQETGMVIGHLRAKEPRTKQSAPAAITPSAEKVTILEEPKLTEEERIETAFKKLFKNDLTDEEMAGLDNKIKALWQDLWGQSSLRTTSFTPGRRMVRLAPSRLLRAGQATYPRIEFTHQEERLDKGIYLSDIGGAVMLEEDLAVGFSIDSNGYLHGEIVNLANENKVAFNILLQLNHRIVELAHKVLVTNHKVLAERAYKSALRTLGGSLTEGAEISSERVKRQLEGSIRYLKPTVETRLPTGELVAVTEIDQEKIEEELRLHPDRPIHITRPISYEILQEIRGRRKKLREEDYSVGGRLVLLPYGYKPSAEGIAKSEYLKQPLVEHIVIELDQYGLPHEMRFYTTIRLWSIKTKEASKEKSAA